MRLLNIYKMDLQQKKLTQDEWEYLEIPVDTEELSILKMIQAGYKNVMIRHNHTKSLLNYIKISGNMDLYHTYFYHKYFEPLFAVLVKRYGCPEFIPQNSLKKKKKKLKKVDIIRITNADTKILKIKDHIYEFILMKQLLKFFKIGSIKSNAILYYYTLTQLLKYRVSNVNTIVSSYLRHIIAHYEKDMKKIDFITHSYEYIERNPYLYRHRDIKLYEHQKKLFTHCKEAGPKFILYQAPTGTGKTLSPIGLVKGHRLIFVCAAKHIGLQLAKSCISLGIKIAVAFGCSDPGGIRLHYFAAKDFQKNRRTGGIFRVDNSVGDNVEIMISDIQSYLPAMRYMLAFNNKENLIWYWDEPTITLDYKTHKYHAVLQKNWLENDIPNIIFSSATLPRKEELQSTIAHFVGTFESKNIISIVSHDCNKTIPIIDSRGYVVLPHFIYNNTEDLKKCLRHIGKYKTLLRHFDLGEITRFIIYVNTHIDLRAPYQIENYFEKVEDIDTLGLKNYYLLLLKVLKEKYEPVHQYFTENRHIYYASTIRLTTADAYTLTDGPTIYLAKDIEKIANYCLKTANIPNSVITTLGRAIDINERLRKEMLAVEKILKKNQDTEEKALRKGSRGKGSGGKEKPTDISHKTGKSRSQIEALTTKRDYLRNSFRPIQLEKMYIPNSYEHLRRWKRGEIANTFCSSIDDSVVERIMQLQVERNWKILLLMGIAVFTKHKCVEYVAIMKELALQQKLYLIIASTDYIYGTNYQFCHGYIGKDLHDISQEKLIQAFGRVGRRTALQDYSIRLRNDNMIQLLFSESTSKIESENMNKLFGISSCK